MKTLEETIKFFKSGCLDGRDAVRLSLFVPENRFDEIGILIPAEAIGKFIPKDWTRENILAQLKEDVDFGFEKAINHRGISAEMMYDVVHMWNWILQEGLEDFDNYPDYGIPLFKATALKYGFPDRSNEYKPEEDWYR
jgi:hypothetical protein